MKDIKAFISSYKDKNYKNVDSLNQRNIDIAFSFACIFSEIIEDYSKNKINLSLFTPKDLFAILVVNEIEDNISKLNFDLPLKYEKLILKPDTSFKLKNIIKIFVPQNKRELKLMKQINSLSVKSEMDDIYEASSINILIKENENNYNIIDDIYIYNSHYENQAINDFLIFINFINAYKQSKIPNFNSCVNPDSNKQFIFINRYVNHQNIQ